MKSVRDVVRTITFERDIHNPYNEEACAECNRIAAILTADRASVEQTKVREIREAIEEVSLLCNASSCKGSPDCINARERGMQVNRILALPCLQIPSPEPPVEPWMVEAARKIRMSEAKWATLDPVTQDAEDAKAIAQVYARRDK